MIFKVRTYNKPLTLGLKVTTSQPRKIIVVGFDPKQERTEYFYRQMWVDGTQTFEFGMPKTPRMLHVLIFDKYEGHIEQPSQLFQVDDIQKFPLRRVNLYMDRKTRDFIRFAEDFSRNAGIYRANELYTDPKKQFLIHYRPDITEVNTPARIHVESDVKQVSKKDFDEFTVPMRFVILCHEYAHNFLNEDMDSEIEADLNGLKIYLSRGYPYIEAIYAFTRIFPDTDVNMQRLRYIEEFLNRHGLPPLDWDEVTMGGPYQGSRNILAA